MPRKGMSQRVCTVLFVLSAISSLATGAAYGLDNPTDGFMPIEYKNNNGEYITTARREFTACYYNVIYNGWCGVGCYTATNQKYNHYHFSDGFPFQDTREGRNEEVTQGKVEAYYTEKVYSPVNWTKIEDPSCEQLSWVRIRYGKCHSICLSWLVSLLEEWVYRMQFSSANSIRHH